jgi:hypothetical protein
MLTGMDILVRDSERGFQRGWPLIGNTSRRSAARCEFIFILKRSYRTKYLLHVRWRSLVSSADAAPNSTAYVREIDDS